MTTYNADSFRSCLLCRKQFENIFTHSIEDCKRVYYICGKYLSEEIKGDSFHWDHTISPHSPFCTVCFKGAEKLYALAQLKGEIQKKLNGYITLFTLEILKARNDLIIVESGCEANADLETFHSQLLNDQQEFSAGLETQDEVPGNLPENGTFDSKILEEGNAVHEDESSGIVCQNEVEISSMRSIHEANPKNLDLNQNEEHISNSMQQQSPLMKETSEITTSFDNQNVQKYLGVSETVVEAKTFDDGLMYFVAEGEHLIYTESVGQGSVEECSETEISTLDASFDEYVANWSNDEGSLGSELLISQVNVHKLEHDLGECNKQPLIRKRQSCQRIQRNHSISDDDINGEIYVKNSRQVETNGAISVVTNYQENCVVTDIFNKDPSSGEGQDCQIIAEIEGAPPKNLVNSATKSIEEHEITVISLIDNEKIVIETESNNLNAQRIEDITELFNCNGKGNKAATDIATLTIEKINPTSSPKEETVVSASTTQNRIIENKNQLDVNSNTPEEIDKMDAGSRLGIKGTKPILKSTPSMFTYSSSHKANSLKNVHVPQHCSAVSFPHVGQGPEAISSNVDSQKRSHAKLKYMTCSICSTLFTNEFDLINHSKTHKELYPTCKVCLLKFLTVDLLSNHSSVHIEQKPAEKGETPNKKRKTNYTNMKSGERIQCYICRLIFSQPSGLESHCLESGHNAFVAVNENDVREISYFVIEKSAPVEMSSPVSQNHSENISSVFPAKPFLDRHVLEANYENYFASIKCPNTEKQHIEKNSYTCDICSKVFDGNLDLQEHVKKHTECFPECTECGLKFPTNTALEEHVKMHKENGIKCYICNENFKWNIPLKCHVKMCRCNKGQKDFLQCDNCQARFEDENSLEDHALTAGHYTNKKFKCSKCTKAFYSNGYLKIHEEAHNRGLIDPEPLFFCKICSASFRSIKSMNRHVRRHSTVYICEFCGKSFKDKVCHKHHLRVHSEEYYLCDLCPLKCYSQEELDDHCNIHKGLEPHKCNSCDKTFATISRLQKHTIVHRAKKVVSCEICNDKFTTMKKLETHMKTHKEKVRCSFCEKQFTNHQILDDHVIASHKDKERIFCKNCPRVFYTRRRLAMHAKCHTKEKSSKFPCHLCKETFKKAEQLRIHIRDHNCPTPSFHTVVLQQD